MILSFLGGVVISLLLIFAKYLLVQLVTTKKQVALRLVGIVVSELLIVFGLYLAIGSYGLDAQSLTLGFLCGLITFVVVLTLSFYVKNRS